MEHSESLNELAAALAKAQGEMKGAEMNSVNPFLKNRYADLGAVIEASRPAMAKNGLSIVQTATGHDGTCTVETMLLHSSGQWIRSSVSLSMGEERGKSAAQVMGSVITYLRRYSYSAMVGVYSDADADGEAQKPAKARQEQTQQPAAASVPAAAMTLDEANAYKNSEGVEYGKLETAKLANMANALRKAIETSTGEELNVRRHKLQAVEIILASRNEK